MAAKKKVTKKKAKKASTELTDGRKKNGSNLNGRPKGVKNKLTLLKEAINSDWEDIARRDARAVFEVLAEKAKDGDTACIKMFLDRAVPVTKAVDINATDIGKTGGITIHIEKLIAETGNPDEVLIEDAEFTEADS